MRAVPALHQQLRRAGSRWSACQQGWRGCGWGRATPAASCTSWQPSTTAAWTRATTQPVGQRGDHSFMHSWECLMLLCLPSACARGPASRPCRLPDHHSAPLATPARVKRGRGKQQPRTTPPRGRCTGLARWWRRSYESQRRTLQRVGQQLRCGLRSKDVTCC